MVSLQFESTTCYSVLQKVQKKLVLCHCLFEKYQECFQEVITPNLQMDNFKAGWIILVLLARHLPSSLLDFTESVNLLINFMISMWKASQNSRLSETIEELFSICNISKDKLDSRYDEYIRTTLSKLTIENLSDFVNNIDSLSKLNMLFDKDEDLTLGSLGFDERIFLYRNDINLIGDISKISSAPVYQLNPPKPTQHNDPFRSPLRSPGHFTATSQTPLQASLLVIQLIEESTKGLSSSPDETLLGYFKSCNIDQTSTIENRLKSLVDKVNFESLLLFNKEKRKQEIMKIYYGTLKHMLQGEEKRLSGTANFSTLLTNENFHRSLTICSIECVSFAYNSKDTIDLQVLLNEFVLEPFELSIVLESFVQNATWLNSALKRQFKSIEEVLLDSLAWKKNSVLYSKLSTSVVPQPPKPGNETPNRNSNIESFGMYSPMASRKQQPQSAPKGSYSVLFFFRKMYKLVSRRIQELCYHFNQTQQSNSEEPMIISMDLMEEVWHTVYYVLNEARGLMVSRHVDHIIMCSMYAICNKVNRMRISFKDIIYNYRIICENIRMISPVEIGKILWQVPLDKEGDLGDIVKFYNLVYIPSVKGFILDKTSGAALDRPEMPYVEIFTKTKIAPNFVLSPRKSNYSKNSLLSPMRHQDNYHTTLLLTPRTKALYEFGTNSTKKHFDQISTTPNRESTSSVINNSDISKRGVKRTLDFGGDDETTNNNNSDQGRKFVKVMNQNPAYQ
ncbi:retinoblastoma protein [Naegleria gruberi]|uniref:Retinoblastoma protein n=1 Tax=Naegleria gruberi TaxID=5762 RepID=D2VQU0_NAEGR|nr:retinoblastoma protein [Naegleria gruberi]EFC40770.1 retinoblastoma protein [Naegleria gruberi]|eukprot:XP_002673514.1 retinoblastoma protein [Naegleria gruberi strain NEG-M]